MTNKHKLVLTLYLLLMIGILVPIPFIAKRICGKPKIKKTEQIKKQYLRPSIVDYADNLRKKHNRLHIYAVSNFFEIWITDTGTKWDTTATLDGARLIVSNYYSTLKAF